MNIKTENINKIIVTKPLKLDCGKTIKDFPLAYETYGKLNKNKDNAILVFHALTGDQFVAGTNPITKKEGWWEFFYNFHILILQLFEYALLIQEVIDMDN